MPIKFIILAVISVIDILFALFLWYRNPREPKMVSYVWFLIFGGLWGLSLFGMEVTSDLGHAVIYLQLSYIAAMGLVLCFSYFASLYPYPSRMISFFEVMVTAIGAFIVSLLILKPGFLVLDVFQVGEIKSGSLNIFGEWIFIIYFIPFVLWSFYELFRKWKKCDGVFHRQLNYLLIGLGVAYFFGILFNLFFVALGSFRYVWLGPCFILVLIIMTTYTVFFRD